MEQIERIREFGGWLNRYVHDSETCRCRMTFSVYLPPQAESARRASAAESRTPPAACIAAPAAR